MLLPFIALAESTSNTNMEEFLNYLRLSVLSLCPVDECRHHRIVADSLLFVCFISVPNLASKRIRISRLVREIR
jgi:hypothetical protein